MLVTDTNTLRCPSCGGTENIVNYDTVEKRFEKMKCGSCGFVDFQREFSTLIEFNLDGEMCRINKSDFACQFIRLPDGRIFQTSDNWDGWNLHPRQAWEIRIVEAQVAGNSSTPEAPPPAG